MGVRSRFAVVTAALLILLACTANADAKADGKPDKRASAQDVSAVCPNDSTAPTSTTAADAAFALLCDMNELRARSGVRPLRWDWRLWTGAQRHANDMAARRYFAHRSLDGRGLVDRIEPTGYLPRNPNRSWLIAENLGFGTTALSTPASIALGWLESPKHRRNLLDPALQDVGISVVQGQIGDGGPVGTIYVADFGVRDDATVRPRGRAGHSRGR